MFKNWFKSPVRSENTVASVRGPVFLKRLKWVKTPEGAGIITGIAGTRITVDLVDSSGVTVKTSNFSHTQIAVAHVDDIPAPRRPDLQTARELGYY